MGPGGPKQITNTLACINKVQLPSSALHGQRRCSAPDLHAALSKDLLQTKLDFMNLRVSAFSVGCSGSYKLDGVQDTQQGLEELVPKEQDAFEDVVDWLSPGGVQTAGWDRQQYRGD